MSALKRARANSRELLERIDTDAMVLFVAFLKRGERDEDGVADDTANRSDLSSTSLRHFRGVVYEAMRLLQCVLVKAYNEQRAYEHVELCFALRGTRKEVAAFSARRDEGVSLFLRTFQNPDYVWHRMYVYREELATMLVFVQRTLGCAYDIDAVQRVYFWPRVHAAAAADEERSKHRRHKTRWFCSEVVLSALQCMDCAPLHRLRANCVDIDDVEGAVRACRRTAAAEGECTPVDVRAMEQVAERMLEEGL